MLQNQSCWRFIAPIPPVLTASWLSRSRSFNRFHRYLARQKRRGLRSVLPQFQMDFEIYGSPIDHSRDMLNRLKGREVELELLDAET